MSPAKLMRFDLLKHGAYAGGPGAAKPQIAWLATRQRRGLTSLGRSIIHASGEALGLPDDPEHRELGDTPIIMGSAYGELDIALELMATGRQQTSSSPIRFRNSVHNATPGLMTISAQSSAPAMSVAAGDDTFAMLVLEAAAQLHAPHTGPVLLIMAHCSPGPEFARATRGRPGAVALLLARSSEHGANNAGSIGSVEVEVEAVEMSTSSAVNLAPRDPMAEAWELSRSIQAGKRSSISLGGSLCVTYSPRA